MAPALTYLSELLTPQEPSCSVTCMDVAPQAAPRSGLKSKGDRVFIIKVLLLKTHFKDLLLCDYDLILI